MADLTITAANVLQTDGNFTDGTAGATITAGQTVYLDATTNRWKLAQADGTSAEASLRGVALHGASNGQPLRVLTSGRYNPGATVAVGTVYVVSATAGGIAPIADLVATNYVSILGVGTTTSEITVSLCNSGVQKA